jgi:hypothetical protein
MTFSPKTLGLGFDGLHDHNGDVAYVEITALVKDKNGRLIGFGHVAYGGNTSQPFERDMTIKIVSPVVPLEPSPDAND